MTLYEVFPTNEVRHILQHDYPEAMMWAHKAHQDAKKDKRHEDDLNNTAKRLSTYAYHMQKLIKEMTEHGSTMIYTSNMDIMDKDIQKIKELEIHIAQYEALV